MASNPKVRLKVLKSLARGGGVTAALSHRYDRLRLLSQSVSLGVLFVVPWLGLARVDAWGGAHYVLGRPAPFKHALAGVIVGIAAMYVVTFLSNIVAGRLFCGWGCPVGQVSRFGERVHTPGLSRRQWLTTHLRGALYSGVFCASVMAWWVDLRVLYAGSGRATLIAWGVLLVGIAGAYLHGRFWRWEFCKSACPIGVYYSFVAPAKYFGVHFRNGPNTCIECNACDHVCPVDLTPRDLTAPVTNRSGLSVGDAPGHNHCLECGDCIRACEMMVGLRRLSPVPLELGWFTGPQAEQAPEGSVPPGRKKREVRSSVA